MARTKTKVSVRAERNSPRNFRIRDMTQKAGTRVRESFDRGVQRTENYARKKPRRAIITAALVGATAALIGRAAARSLARRLPFRRNY